MHYLILALIAAIVGYLIYRGRSRAPAPAPDEPQQIAAAAPASEPATPAQIAERLNALNESLETKIQNSNHPHDLDDDADFIAARDLLADPATPFDITLRYAIGSNLTLACPALVALARRPERQQAMQRVMERAPELGAWSLAFALEALEAMPQRPAMGAPLARVGGWWADNTHYLDVVRAYLERRANAGDAPVFDPNAPASTRETMQATRAFLAAIAHPAAQALVADLDDRLARHLDEVWLTSVGTLWRNDDALLVEPAQWRDALDAAQRTPLRQPPRSLIVVGEAQTGKTSFLRLLAARLADDGWRVFDAGGPELMAGQQYFGQLEERLQRLIGELAVSKKVIWRTADLLQLARTGAHQGQSATILDQIFPALTAGRLVLWSEATPATLTRLLQTAPALRNTLETVRLDIMEPDAAAALAQTLAARIAQTTGVVIDARAIDTALDTAPHYIAGGALPGSALTLLRLAAEQKAQTHRRNEASPADKPTHVGADDVLAALARLTGLPQSILDGGERLDLSAMRAFFRARVIGQDHAVDAVIDRIAMLKAGLNDPSKPIGVFLFAGPTGAGKTELAKTTADYLFGDPERMIRLDMSEFQTMDSLAKIVGDGNPNDDGSLIARVRKQPFSVVLLDEFEKAYAGVWDLFLQVFDDGRLSDSSGRVADFRHCIIILTSNLGATEHQSAGFGFATAQTAFSDEQVMRAIERVYRPEFRNRIDKIIVFQPLTRDLMRAILSKELDGVLARRGLRDRGWAVEWEPSAIEFLLEKGFSPELGARPLKRAIDQHLLAPLAATIVERRFPDGEQFVFVRSDGRAIVAEFIDPDAPAASVAPRPTPVAADRRTLTQIILSPHGDADDVAHIDRALEEARDILDSDTVEAMKTACADAMAQQGFWSDPRRHETLTRYALIDRIAAALRGARALRERIGAVEQRRKPMARDLLARLAMQTWLVRAGLDDLFENAPVEVAVLVEPALDGAGDEAAARAWRDAILAMLRKWRERRHMQGEEIAGPEATPILIVSGFGAARTLARQVGLHVLERDDADGLARFAARIVVAPTPLADMAPAQRRNAILAALAATPRANAITRRYRRARAGEPAQVRDGAGLWRDSRLEETLRGDFDLIAPDA